MEVMGAPRAKIRLLFGFGVFCDACYIEHHTTLVPNYPSIMSRWHIKNITRPVFHLRPIIHLDDHSAFKNGACMSSLARIRSCYRFHMQTPAPPRFKLAAAHCMVAKRKDRQPAFSFFEWTNFIRLVQRFFL